MAKKAPAKKKVSKKKTAAKKAAPAVPQTRMEMKAAFLKAKRDYAEQQAAGFNARK
jgi:hypothetical protein